MKNRYFLLLKMQLYNLFGINRILHSQSKKEKQRSAVLAGFAILIVGLMIVYSAIISIGFASMGAINILPTISVLIFFGITHFFSPPVTIYLPLDLWQPAIGMGHLVAKAV